MKKLSVLVALMLIITVGGVYATWNYAYVTGNVDSVSRPITVKLDDKVMSGEDSSTDKGTISITSNNVSLVIDQDKPSYDAKWVTNGGKITGTFTPDDNATDDVKNNGIPLQFTLSGTNLPSELTINYAPVNISYDDNDFNWTITAEQIANAISLARVNLPTVEAYNAFADALDNAEFTITISECVDDGVHAEQGGTDR